MPSSTTGGTPAATTTACGHRISKHAVVTEMVCWATGGPPRYSGRNLRDSRAHLNTTEDKCQVFLADFQACLGHFAVPKAEPAGLFAIVKST